MVKIKGIKQADVRKGRKSRFSKVSTGKVKKINKTLGSVNLAGSISDGVQNLGRTIKSEIDNNAGKKVLGSKIKLLKKKFGNALVPGKASVNGQVGKNAVQRGVSSTLNSAKGGKKKKEKKKKQHVLPKSEEEEEAKPPPLTRFSDDPIPRKDKWINKQRVLLFCCRGIGSRDRHLLKDLRKLMPHARPESKMERKENLAVVNEMCEMKHCNKCVLLEGRANRDVYMWISNISNGPSVKFLLQNIYTMDELRFTGNCLVGSRPLLSFDENFENILHYRLMKELLVQIFGTPKHHPKSQPFFDHVYTFTVLDNRIWFRNYQILAEDGALVEIGPRFVMNPVKIFEKSFGGETIWQNPHYVTPAKLRQIVRKAASGKYVNRLNKKVNLERNRGQPSYKFPETSEVFTADTWSKAKEIVSKKVQVGGPVQSEQKKRKKKKVKKQKDGDGETEALQTWSVEDVQAQNGE